MKKIKYMLLAVCALAVSCSKEPFSTAEPNDFPVILDPQLADPESGSTIIKEFPHTEDYEVKLVVTPAAYCDVVWYVDGKEFAKGCDLKVNFPAGYYKMKVVVTNRVNGKSTSRSGILISQPLDGEPTNPNGAAMLTAPGYVFSMPYKEGTTVTDPVTAIKFGDTLIEDVIIADGVITFTVPADAKAENYRLLFVTASGFEFGAGLARVETQTIVTDGFRSANTKQGLKLTGINMEKIKAVKIGETVITTFTSQSNAELTADISQFEDGEYKFTIETTDGEYLFHNGEEDVKEYMMTLQSKAVVLWEGSHYVSWELPDGNPNKTFNQLQTVMKEQKAGSKVVVAYKKEPGLGYYQMQFNTAWWGALPGTGTIDLPADEGTESFLLTQDCIDLMNAQDGFLICGHGFYVTSVTIE